MRTAEPRGPVLVAAPLFVSFALLVFDPSGGLTGNLRLAAAASGALLALFHLGLERSKLDVRSTLQAATFGLIVPTYGIAVHFWRGDYLEGNWSIFNGAYLYFIFVLACIGAVGYRRSFTILVRLLTALAVVTITLFFLGQVLAEEAIYNFGYSHDLFTYGSRSYGPAQLPLVYMYSSPMIVIAAVYWLFQVRKEASSKWASLWFLTCTSALLLSGTRGNVAIGLFVLLMLLWRASRMVGVLTAVVAAWLLSQLPFQQLVLSTSAGTVATSNEVRAQLLSQYALLANNFWDTLFGYGLGSCIYSGSRGCVTVAEFTYLDAVRIFGLLGATAIGAVVAICLTDARRTFPDLFSGLLLYLAVCVFNPYFFSALGFTLVALVVQAAAESRASLHKGQEGHLPADELAETAPFRVAAPG